MKIKNFNTLVFAFFVIFVFVLRFPSFLQPIMSNDESLYLLMAKSMLEGHAPYTAVWDNKPIGIYIIYCLALLIFGNSVTSLFIAGAVAIATTCYFLYLLGSKINEDNKSIGLLTGILYAIFTLGSGGIFTNTEIFFAPFAVSAFYLLLSGLNESSKPITKSLFKLFAIGLLMGIGFQIKQVVLFEFIAILLILGIYRYRQFSITGRIPVGEIVQNNAILICGFILPFLTTSLYFVASGHFNDYVHANFSANLARVSGESLSLGNFATGFIIQFKSNLLLWASLALIPFYLTVSKDNNTLEKRNLTYLFIWLAMAFLGVCAPKSFYVHYFIQLFPILCLLSSYLIAKTIQSEGIDTAKKLIILILIIAQPLFVNVYPAFKVGVQTAYQQTIKKVDNWGNNAATVAAYLQGKVHKNDYIYVADYETVIYYYVPAKAPTKYVFFDFLLVPKLISVAGVDTVQELDSIFRKQPKYVVRLKPQATQEQEYYIELDKHMKNSYALEKEFNLEDNLSELTLTKENPVTVQLYRLNA